MSDLVAVQVSRKQAVGAGVLRIRNKVDFLSLMTVGGESLNIRNFDGDVVSVGKGNIIKKYLLHKAVQIDLSSQLIEFHISAGSLRIVA